MKPRRPLKLRLSPVIALESRELLSVSGAGPLATATVDNSAVIQLASTTSSSKMVEVIYESGGYADGSYGASTWGVVFGPGVSRDDILNQWQNSGIIDSYSTDEAIHASALPVSDPMAPQQWAIAGGATASVNAGAAWSRTVGAGVIVAVIDSGVDYNHPELAGQLWVNPGEAAGNNRDDDKDGIIDDVHGANFINNTGYIYDDAGHGTHVSGIIAAAANNGNGGVGLAPGAKIMALKVLDSMGNGSLNAAVKAIRYAVDHGAKVINTSWTMSIGSPSLQSAMAYAASKNVVVVTAAGNENTNNNIIPSYPGSYHYTNVLTVGAVDSSGRLADFSNYGSSSVDIAAPGVGILSTVPGSYDTWDGTSMASPYVAATAALIASLRPDYSAAQIVNQIKSTAHMTSELSGRIASAGYLDAGAATNLAPYVPSTPTTTTRTVTKTPSPAAQRAAAAAARRQAMLRRLQLRKLSQRNIQRQSVQ